jgi:hypothetical protein
VKFTRDFDSAKSPVKNGQLVKARGDKINMQKTTALHTDIESFECGIFVYRCFVGNICLTRSFSMVIAIKGEYANASNSDGLSGFGKVKRKGNSLNINKSSCK